MMRSQRTFTRRAVMAGAATLALTPARAQNPPSGARVVSPAPPGGSTDALARILAPEFTAIFGSQFMVDYRAGAGTNIGNEFVARAAPDGGTLLILTIASTINRALNPKLRYDPRTDFAPLAGLSSVPNVMVIGPPLMEKGVKDVAGFIAEARKTKATYNFASNGIGTTLHLTGELFTLRTGIPLQHVPYKGWADAAASLVRGESQIMFDNVSTALANIQAGKVRALAVTAATRSRVLPDVPTMEEAGIKDLVVVPWFGVAVTKGTPPDLVARYENAVAAIMKKPEVMAAITKYGMDTDYLPAPAFAKRINDEIDRWMEIGKKANVTLE